MSNTVYKVNGSDLESVADHIRSKSGVTGSLTFPDGFNDAIDSISGGGSSTVTLVPHQSINAQYQFNFYTDTISMADEYYAPYPYDGVVCTVTFDGVEYTTVSMDDDKMILGADDPLFSVVPFYIEMDLFGEDSYIITETSGAHTVEVTYKISASGGGGGVEEKDVNFIDYNGDLLYSYTKADFANLSAMPANPNHTDMGLSAQGWNWTLANAKTYVASYGKLWIGQEYDTVSGYVEIDVIFDDVLNLSPYLGVAISGTLEVIWGDGSVAETITGTSLSALKTVQHTFPSINTKYTMKIKATSGSFTFYYQSSVYPSILLARSGSNTSANSTYSKCIKAIRFSSTAGIASGVTCYVGMLPEVEYITIPSCAYAYRIYCNNYRSIKALVVPHGTTTLQSASSMNAMEYISLPYEMTTLPAFSSCYSLKGISVPPQVTSLQSSTFNTTKLTEIVLPSAVTSTNSSSVFYNCFVLKKVKFSTAQAITLGTSMFQYCSSLEEIEGLNLGTASTLNSSIFASCYMLKTIIVLPSQLTAIPSGLFQNCYSMEKITVPSAVTSIATNGLADLRGLYELRFEPTTPPTLAASSSISNLNYGCKIYVPESAIYAYTNGTNYPSKSSYTYIGFATYTNGDILPITDTTGNYELQWYATKEDCINGTNEIYNGNGSEVYCWYTAL